MYLCFLTRIHANEKLTLLFERKFFMCGKMASKFLPVLKSHMCPGGWKEGIQESLLLASAHGFAIKLLLESCANDNFKFIFKSVK